MNRTKTIAIISISIILTAILGFTLTRVLVVNQNGSGKHLSPNEMMIQAYIKAKNDKSLDPTAKAAILEKLQPEVDEGTQNAINLNAFIQGTKPLILNTPAPTGIHKHPDGIDNQPSYPLASYKKYKLTNAWIKTMENDVTYLVFGGALADDATQGVVYMEVPGTAAFRAYLSPTKDGVLKITEESNLRLTFSSESGKVFYFDVMSSQFVDSKGNPLGNQPSNKLSTSIPAYP